MRNDLVDGYQPEVIVKLVKGLVSFHQLEKEASDQGRLVGPLFLLLVQLP